MQSNTIAGIKWEGAWEELKSLGDDITWPGLVKCCTMKYAEKMLGKECV